MRETEAIHTTAEYRQEHHSKNDAHVETEEGKQDSLLVVIFGRGFFCLFLRFFLFDLLFLFGLFFLRGPELLEPEQGLRLLPRRKNSTS